MSNQQKPTPSSPWVKLIAEAEKHNINVLTELDSITIEIKTKLAKENPNMSAEAINMFVHLETRAALGAMLRKHGIYMTNDGPISEEEYNSRTQNLDITSLKMPELRYNPNFSNEEISNYQKMVEETIAKELLNTKQNESVGANKNTKQSITEAKESFKSLLNNQKTPNPQKTTIKKGQG